MAISDFRLLGSASLVAAFSLIGPAQAMDDASAIRYTGPLLKQIDAAEGGDGLASVAAAGLMLKFEEASRNNPTKPEIVQDARGKYWFGAVVGDKQIAGCGAHLTEDRKTVGPAFVKFAINTQTGAVEVSKIDGDCKAIIKAARDAMTQKMPPQPSQREGESSSDGRIKQNSPE